VGERNKLRILVVEDDLENQKFLKIFLRKQFDVDICDSADTFYEKLENSAFDIILMDISLRGAKDGLELTQEIRNNFKYKNIPIVGLSAHAYQKDKDNAYRAGIDIFITKPVQGDVLTRSLAVALEQRDNTIL
jgi:CheY-like chemotaxis protein